MLWVDNADSVKSDALFNHIMGVSICIEMHTNMLRMILLQIIHQPVVSIFMFLLLWQCSVLFVKYLTIIHITGRWCSVSLCIALFELTVAYLTCTTDVHTST